MQKDDRVGTVVNWELCQRLEIQPINKLNQYKSTVREIKMINYFFLKSRPITTSSKHEDQISL